MDLLLNDLQSEDWQVRWYALDRLASIKHASALRVFCDALEDENAEVRQLAAMNLGEKADTVVLPALAKALEDENMEVRQQVVIALGSIGDASVASALEKVLQDTDKRVSDLAMISLEKIGYRTLSRVIEKLHSPTESLRLEAVKQLEESGNASALPFLLGARRDGSWKVAGRVIGALVRLGGYGRTVVREIALHDDDWQMRLHAASALRGEGRDADSVSALIELLRDEDERVRRAAVISLSLFHESMVFAALIAACGDESAAVRAEIADTIRWIGEYPWSGIYSNSTPAELRQVLEEALLSENERVRQAATYYLKEMDLPDPFMR